MSIAKIRVKCLRIYFFLSKQTLLFFLMIQKFLEFDLVFEKACKSFYIRIFNSKYFKIRCLLNFILVNDYMVNYDLF